MTDEAAHVLILADGRYRGYIWPARARTYWAHLAEQGRGIASAHCATYEQAQAWLLAEAARILEGDALC